MNKENKGGKNFKIKQYDLLLIIIKRYQVTITFVGKFINIFYIIFSLMLFMYMLKIVVLILHFFGKFINIILYFH